MTDNVKYLPTEAIPQGGAAVWAVDDARRWFAAHTPGFFSPGPGSWVLAALLLPTVVLLAWNEPDVLPLGTDWADYGDVVLLLGLPVWFRFLPALTLFSAPLLAVVAALELTATADAAGRVGGALVLASCAYAFAGALLRLRSRRRQRELALAAAGNTRAPLPEQLPKGHTRRGVRLLLVGTGLCLAAAACLGWGLAEDLGAQRGGIRYDAFGQQILALLLLTTGVPVLGRGITARLAARRLHAGPQAVLRVGVRSRYPGHLWLYPDARTTDAPSLIAYRNRYADRRGRARTLFGGEQSRLRRDHFDINEESEPYEALLYGVPYEGAEVVLEHAEIFGGTLLTTTVTAAPLLPRRRGRPGSWRATTSSYRARVAAEADRRRAEEAARGSDSGSGCGSSGGCGSSCSSSCGGGCGGD